MSRQTIFQSFTWLDSGTGSTGRTCLPPPSLEQSSPRAQRGPWQGGVSQWLCPPQRHAPPGSPPLSPSCPGSGSHLPRQQEVDQYPAAPCTYIWSSSFSWKFYGNLSSRKCRVFSVSVNLVSFSSSHLSFSFKTYEDKKKRVFEMITWWSKMRESPRGRQPTRFSSPRTYVEEVSSTLGGSNTCFTGC